MAAAKALLEADNPLLLAGDDVTTCGAETELLELAEILALPVAVSSPLPVSWSKPFPTRNPLYVGPYLAASRFPGKVDVMFNLGSRMPHPSGGPLQIEPGTRLYELRNNPEELARNYPAAMSLFGDIKIGTAGLAEAVKSLLPARELERLRADRYARISTYSGTAREYRRDIARRRWDNEPISVERLVMELESALEPETCVVAEIDSAIGAVDSLMHFGGQDKRYLSNAGFALGWGLPAALGIKLAIPNRPVVALLTDGGILFSGPQPLWSYSRYQAPVTVVVMNNRSYNNERNRIWAQRGRQFQSGRDMVCYLGDPDVDFAKIAQAFGVESETVSKPGDIRHALGRSLRANGDGRPYLLDVVVGRRGNGATSTWHPPFSIAALAKQGRRT